MTYTPVYDIFYVKRCCTAHEHVVVGTRLVGLYFQFVKHECDLRRVLCCDIPGAVGMVWVGTNTRTRV